MMEPQISPLARRLAEENSIDWRVINGTGPEGRVIERDILTYLARIMSGEIDPPSLPDASEQPPSHGMTMPDLGSVSNLAAASAGMAKEGIDLSSLLNPSGDSSSQSSLSQPSVDQRTVTQSTVTQSSPNQHFAPAANPDLVPPILETGLATAPLSFGEPVMEATPVQADAPSSLDQISFGDAPAFEAAPAFKATPAFELPAVPAFELADATLETPSPVLESAPSHDDFISLSPDLETATPSFETPTPEVAAVPMAASAHNDSWSFPPPLSVADSGVEFEIDIDSFDDLPDAPPAIHTPSLGDSEPISAVSDVTALSSLEEDLVLDVPSDFEQAAATDSVMLEDGGLHDDLVIGEFAPVAQPEPAIQTSDDFELDLDEPLAASVSPSDTALPEDIFALEPVPSTPDPMPAAALDLPDFELNPPAPTFDIAAPLAATAAVVAPVAAFNLMDSSDAVIEPAHLEPVAIEAPQAEPAMQHQPEAASAPVVSAPAAVDSSPTPASQPVQTEPVPTPASSQPAAHQTVSGGFYQGFAVRRHFDASALTVMRDQLSKVLNGREIPLEVFLARAAQHHLGALGVTDRVTLARLGDHLEAMNAPALHHSFLEALQSAARATPGAAEGLMVLDASHLGADDLVLPAGQPLLTLNVKGEYGHLSLAGDLPATRAAEFLGKVAEALEVPVSLVI